MVNADLFSPALLLGVAMIMSGVTLFSIRKSNAELSRDSDVFLSSMVIVTGSVMIFQGWRLDPILLLSQLMLCFVAGAFALEAFSLRGQRPSNAPPPAQRPDERFYEDSFFDDLPTDSLPSPRSTADSLLSGEPDEGWSVEEGGFYGEEDRWSDEAPREDRKGVLQAVEDWE